MTGWAASVLSMAAWSPAGTRAELLAGRGELCAGWATPWVPAKATLATRAPSELATRTSVHPMGTAPRQPPSRWCHAPVGPPAPRPGFLIREPSGQAGRPW